MKSMIKWILAIQIAFAPAFANAETNPVASEKFTGAIRLIDGFFGRLKTDSPLWTGPMPGEKESSPINIERFFGEQIAGGEMMSKMVATEILALEPLDFNGLVLWMMYDYVIHPERRANYMPFIQMIHDRIEGDLANTAKLQSGPWNNVPMNAVEKSSWLFFTALAMGTVFNLWRRGHGTIFAQAEAKGIAASTGQGFLKRLGTGVTNPGVWVSIAGGTFWGFEEWKNEVSKTAYMNPLTAMRIVQAELACNLSYMGLELEERMDVIRKNKYAAITEGDQLYKDMADLQAQAEMLTEQFPILDKLTMNDPLFQENYQRLPKAQNWDELRTFVTERLKNGETRCSEVSLTFVASEMEEQKAELAIIYGGLNLNNKGK